MGSSISKLQWIDDQSLLLSGAIDHKKRFAYRFDLTSEKRSWAIDEVHDLTAAMAIPLSADSFVQAGAVFHRRSLNDGEIVETIPVERLYGRRHGELYRRLDDSVFLSWGYDLAGSYNFNSSDGFVCWNADDLSARFSFMDLGNDGMFTMTPSGQIISKLDETLDHLVWIVQTADGRSLENAEAFFERYDVDAQ